MTTVIITCRRGGGANFHNFLPPLQKFPFLGGWRVINFWNTVKQFSWNMRETWPNFPLQIWQAAGKIFYPRPRDFFLFSFLEEGKMCGQKIPFFCDKYFFMLWVIPIKVSLQIHPLEILSPCFPLKLYFVKIKNLYFFLGRREGIIQFLFLQIFYFHKTKFYQI